MSESLKKALRADIACHEASLFTTPHLSRIHHAEVALLALLEEKVRHVVIVDEHVKADPVVHRPLILDEMDKPGARQHARFAAPLKDSLTLVELLDSLRLDDGSEFQVTIVKSRG